MEQKKIVAIEEIIANAETLLHTEVSTRGRLHTIRAMKMFWFADLGLRNTKIQISAQSDVEVAHVKAGDLVEVNGCLYKTKTGELTIAVTHVGIISAWNNTWGYDSKNAAVSGPLFSFMPDAYDQLLWHQLCNNSIREFLTSRHFLEVQTPIVLKRYNGGRSFPITCSYLKDPIGFVRTTMEERMQALIACGFERIFQIGNIFRGEKEKILFEAYCAYMEWEEGKQVFIDLLSHIVKQLSLQGIGEETEIVRKVIKKEWTEVDFFVQAQEIWGFSHPELEKGGQDLLVLAVEKEIVKAHTISQETLADAMSNEIALRQEMPVIVSGFPVWSSPLYKGYDENGVQKLWRARLYLPGDKTGAEMGIQENDVHQFLQRLHLQRLAWQLPAEDERIQASDLAQVISGGLPQIFGFATNTDRLIRLWRQDGTIDPFNEI